MNLKNFLIKTYRCYYYQEIDSYTKYLRLLIEKSLKIYTNSDKPLKEIAIDILEHRHYTGRSHILSSDRDSFKKVCIQTINIIQNLINKYHLNVFNIPFQYKSLVKGKIDTTIPLKEINICFSYENALITQNYLAFYEINNYIYNISTKNSKDCLVISLPSKTSWLIKYNPADYTMNRGYFTINSKSKLRKSGEYCITCRKSCKPFYIPIDKLEIL